MKFNLGAIQSHDKELEQIVPSDIFRLLPKDGKKYSYLRDVQAEVLDKWFSRKDDKEIVIQMNTGSGKTIVSLLILESSIKAGHGPAVYVVPDNFLATQVVQEATNLGIKTTTNSEDISFIRQKAILVITIHKLFNARSVFGVGDEGIKIDVGTFLIDDTHACIDKIEEQFTLSIENSSAKYKLLFALFQHDLKKQSETKFSDLEASTPNTFFQIPFWSIQSHSKEIYAILAKDVDTDAALEWKFRMLADYIKYCDCVISEKKVEFSIRVIPTEVIRSYAKARKVIVSATLPDDSILMSYLNISENAIKNPITPKSASDLGERLIIVPEAINPQISKTLIREMIVDYAKKVKVVVIVPSFYKAKYWEDAAVAVLSATNIEDGLEKFKSKSAGLIVLINKYDGIDLPDDDCRILVIDELPDDRSELEKVDSSVLSNNNSAILRKVRKIEQGMGRAIRSNEDYSVVLLLGKSLTNHLYARNAISNFTPGTKKQFAVSSQLLEQLDKGTILDIRDAIDLVLSRNPEWITAIKSSLIGLSFKTEISNSFAFAFSKAYHFLWAGNSEQAIKVMEDAANSASDDQIQGWLKYYLGFAMNFQDTPGAQTILRSAVGLNPRLPKPIDGIRYQKLTSVATQAERCKTYLSRFSDQTNNLYISANGVLEDLVFQPDTANKFEAAIKNIGLFIGFGAQRPENDYGRGPDNLWECGNLQFIVIECKNGITSSNPNINKHDINQMNGSIVWFETEYDSSCQMTPIIIHPYLTYEHAASPDQRIRIMNAEKLNMFTDAVNKFLIAVVTPAGQIAELDKIRRLLVDYQLTPNLIVENYSILLR